MNHLLIIDTDKDVYADEIKRRNLSNLKIHVAASPDQGEQFVQAANIILGRPALVAGLLDKAGRLEWVQSTFAGVETLCLPGLRRDYTLTGVKGIFGPLMSEYVMAYLLAMERHLFEIRDQQAQKKWHAIPYRSLNGLTLGIAGLGSIGRHLACTADHFGMRVLGLKRRPQSEKYVEAVFSPDELEHFLPELDYLVLALPDTPATRNIIDAEAIGMMKGSAVLINVGRGTAVDETALTAALRNASIRGAVLDVFESEPLDLESPLWGMPGVHITPHCAAFSFPQQIARIFCENYRRFVMGEPLKYTVDVDRGY